MKCYNEDMPAIKVLYSTCILRIFISRLLKRLFIRLQCFFHVLGIAYSVFSFSLLLFYAPIVCTARILRLFSNIQASKQCIMQRPFNFSAVCYMRLRINAHNYSRKYCLTFDFRFSPIYKQV